MRRERSRRVTGGLKAAAKNLGLADASGEIFGGFFPV